MERSLLPENNADAVTRRINRVRRDLAFWRAEVTDVSAGLVQITRGGQVSPDDEYYGHLAGFVPQVGDEVVCCDYNGSVLVLGVLEYAAPTAAYVTPGSVRIGASGGVLRSGSGSPEGAVVGSVGDLYLRTDGASGTILYEKATGAATNTGWVANSAAAGSTGIVVQEGDSTVDATVGTLDFDATAFNVTESPEDEANIALAFGTGSGQPAEGNHNHDADYADVSHEHAGLVLAQTLKAVYPNPGLATAAVVGTAAVVLNATVANADDADGSWLSHTTAASSGSATSMRSAIPADQVRRDWLPDLEIRIKTGSAISTVRYWIGLTDALPNSSADPTLHGAMFRFDTGASDSNWQAWTNDNSGGGSAQDTGVAVAADTVYVMRIRCLASTIEFSINGTLVATASSNLPSASAMLAFNISCATLANVGRVIKWGRLLVAFV